MRKHFIVPLAVAFMMATALMTAALFPTPALAFESCDNHITYRPDATPSAQSVQQGATADYAVTVVTSTGVFGSSASAFFSTLSVMGLPDGFTATFTTQGRYDANDQPVGQLAVQTTTGHLGTYTLQITGTGPACSFTLGNHFTLTVTDTTDTTAPTTTATLAGTTGTDPWYTSAVTVTLAATDPDGTAANITTTYTVDGGAAQAYTGPFTVSGDGTHTVTYSSTDKAGNVEATKTQSIMIDATAPTAVVGTPDRAPNATGWYNAPVKVTFSGQDATSSIASCTSTTYSGPDSATATVTGSCTDKAGNSASGSFALKYDATAPVTTATPDRAANTSGWYNAPVKVTVRATDTLSGVAKSQYNLDNAGWLDYVPGTPVTVSGDLIHTLLSRSVDNAGNREADGTLTIKIDAAAPTGVAGAAARGADSNGWYNKPVALTFTGADSLSGIDTCTSTTYSGPESAAAAVTGTCTDKAGNTSAPVTFTFTYDATKPTDVVGTPDRAPNANGWYNAPVTVKFTGSDATSGIAACMSAATYSGPDSATASVPGSCTDKAGNVATAAFALKYDATPPTITYTGNAGTYTILDTVAISCKAADNLSGIATTTCKDIAAPAYTFNVGANSFSATATDKAGNVGSGSTSFAVTVDAASLSTLVNQFVANKGIANSLTKKIAKGNIQPFINEVNAQTGKAITADKAAILIKLANAL